MVNVDVEKINAIALLAGAAIMEVYTRDDFGVTHKENESPLTLADIASHQTIVRELSKIEPLLPIVSEEGDDVNWEKRKNFESYWLVDPLDGTKEFIKRNGEFTVNIALIHNHRPVLGVVYAPDKELLYYGVAGQGAHKISGQGSPKSIHVAPVKQPYECWKIVGSRSHQSDEFKDFAGKFERTELISMGSSLKLCLVAEGQADLYPRLGPTSEWDTAAAQAVVEAAGGQVIDENTGEPLLYNTKESILNPYFIVCASKARPWFNTETSNIVWHSMEVDKQARASRFKQKPAVIWFTGLSGAGKSTSAAALEKKLFSIGYSTYLLDGDNVRHGLCSDLGFSDRDRGENIRRVGEVAKLMVDAGHIVLASFISPFIRERQMVRGLVEPGEFIEVHVNTPIDICEDRDPKGLYKKARDGQIKNFTGIDSPYEVPEDPEIEVNTGDLSLEQVVDHLTEELRKLKVI